MSYGMFVRYNAHVWEKFIDKKNSNEGTLIELSINNSVNTFILKFTTLYLITIIEKIHIMT